MMIDYPKAAHSRCVSGRDGGRLAQRDLPKLRQAYTALTALRAEVESLGRFLRAVGDADSGDAPSMVEEYQLRRKVLGEKYQELEPLLIGAEEEVGW